MPIIKRPSLYLSFIVHWNQLPLLRSPIQYLPHHVQWYLVRTYMIDNMVVICNFQLLASISPIICSYAVSAEDTDISRPLSIRIQDSYSLRMHKVPHFIFLHTAVSHFELDIQDKNSPIMHTFLILLPAFLVAFLWWLSSNIPNVITMF